MQKVDDPNEIDGPIMKNYVMLVKWQIFPSLKSGKLQFHSKNVIKLNSKCNKSLNFILTFPTKETIISNEFQCCEKWKSETKVLLFLHFYNPWE